MGWGGVRSDRVASSGVGSGRGYLYLNPYTSTPDPNPDLSTDPSTDPTPTLALTYLKDLAQQGLEHWVDHIAKVVISSDIADIAAQVHRRQGCRSAHESPWRR